MRAALLMSVCLVLAACVGGGRGREDDGVSAGPPRLFLSPSGQPYRATPEEPNAMLVWFQAIAADHDGRLTEAEFVADANRVFAMVDADHDGLATSPEVSEMRRRIAPELDAMAFGFAGVRSDEPTPQIDDDQPGAVPPRTARGPEGGPPGVARRMRPMSSLGLLGEREPILASDADFNRRVTQEEFDAAAHDRFQRLDPHHQGVLTTAGLQEILAARQAELRRRMRRGR